MKAIKKVEVVPLDYNEGKIINSATSTDDKTRNTYSMNIIDGKFEDASDEVDDKIVSTKEWVSDELNDYATKVYVQDNFVYSNRFATFTTSLIETLESENINYPSSFTKDNCVVLSIMYSTNALNWYTLMGGEINTGTSGISVQFLENYIKVYNVTNQDYYVKVVLMKIS